jgi:hypothetical protein
MHKFSITFEVFQHNELLTKDRGNLHLRWYLNRTMFCYLAGI